MTNRTCLFYSLIVLVGAIAVYCGCLRPAPVPPIAYPKRHAIVREARREALSNLQLHLCAHRVRPDVVDETDRVRDATGYRFRYVFDVGECRAPYEIIRPELAGTPRDKVEYEHIRDLILDWSGHFVYGDIHPPGGNGVLDVDDILTMLRAIADYQPVPEPWSIPRPIAGPDIHPCGGGDGDIDSDDLLAMLRAFRFGGDCP